MRSHRLLGYENRLTRDEDFNDEIEGAGELGAGHGVTALYEVERIDLSPWLRRRASLGVSLLAGPAADAF